MLCPASLNVTSNLSLYAYTKPNSFSILDPSNAGPSYRFECKVVVECGGVCSSCYPCLIYQHFRCDARVKDTRRLEEPERHLESRNGIRWEMLPQDSRLVYHPQPFGVAYNVP